MVLQPMRVLETASEAIDLAKDLLRAGALPAKAADDALHIAVAATKAVPNLLTWNCRHLANAVMRPAIESVCKAKGYAVDLDSPPANRVQTTVSRIVRDTELTIRVKREHSHRCQLCGETIRLSDGTGYAEGHHLRPLGKPHDGPDLAENIVCVCPNHHAACDLGAIRLEVRQLRLAGNHKVGERFVAYHNEVIFRG